MVHDNGSPELKRIGQFAALDGETLTDESELLDLFERSHIALNLENLGIDEVVDSSVGEQRINVIGGDSESSCLLRKGVDIRYDDCRHVRSAVTDDDTLFDIGMEERRILSAAERCTSRWRS